MLRCQKTGSHGNVINKFIMYCVMCSTTAMIVLSFCFLLLPHSTRNITWGSYCKESTCLLQGQDLSTVVVEMIFRG